MSCLWAPCKGLTTRSKFRILSISPATIYFRPWDCHHCWVPRFNPKEIHIILESHRRFRPNTCSPNRHGPLCKRTGVAQEGVRPSDHGPRAVHGLAWFTWSFITVHHTGHGLQSWSIKKSCISCTIGLPIAYGWAWSNGHGLFLILIEHNFLVISSI